MRIISTLAACFILVSVVVLAASPQQAAAQTLQKQIKVKLPERVMVGEKTLEPGEYLFREASPKLVQVFNNDEMRAEAAVITIDTEDSKPAEETKVILHRFGGTDHYYIDKIWMQGRTIGYEFQLPERLKSLEEEQELSLAGDYEDIDHKFGC